MAMLLAMYQKMRLIREKNQATLDLTRFSSKYDRVSKNIERVQKMYTSKIASLESQAKMKMSLAKSVFQQGFGLSMDASSPYLNAGMAGSQSYYTQRMLAQFCKDQKVYGVSQVPQKDENGNVIDGKFNYIFDGKGEYALDGNALVLLQNYVSNGKIGEATETDDGNISVGDLVLSKDEWQKFYNAKTAAEGAYQIQYQNCYQANTNYETNVSIWLEAAKAQLEAEQDAVVEPLAYQQTMWELEKEQTENKLTRIKEELQHYDQLLGDECKGHAPRFGLG